MLIIRKFLLGNLYALIFLNSKIITPFTQRHATVSEY